MGFKNKNWLAGIRGDSGQGLTEYLILMVLVAVVCIGAGKTLGSTVKQKLELVNRHIKSDITVE